MYIEYLHIYIYPSNKSKKVLDFHEEIINSIKLAKSRPE